LTLQGTSGRVRSRSSGLVLEYRVGGVRSSWLIVLGLAVLAPDASAGMRARRMVVVGEILHVSPVLKRKIVAHTRLSDWAGKFKRPDADWKEATRFRRLPGGEALDDKLHIGRRPVGDHGYRWLIRLSQARLGPPPPDAVTNEVEDGVSVTVEKVGALLASRVIAATKLPNDYTLEVAAEVIEAKRQVPFEELTYKGSPGRAKSPPAGTFVLRDGRGVVGASGDLRALWRRAISRDGRWATKTLGLRLGELQELLVDLTN
jgi:hypothetical protein